LLLAGVIGWPVSHSRSPRLHTHWLRSLGIDGAYLPLPVRPEDFGAALQGLRACGFRGANVTIPHKEAAFALCDTVDQIAHRAGAVNTLVLGEHGVHGTSTDGAGFLANLHAHGIDPAAGPALILGAGGAARAIAAALQESGARVAVCNRGQARAEALAAALPGVTVVAWEHRSAAVEDHALLVNTTSLGMQGQPVLDIDLSRALPGMAVADIVYVPLLTALLRQAEAHGMRTVGGLGMLLHQAVPGFAAWFGATPVVDQAAFDLLAAGIPLE
jgi:shikimate dehydrogenase